MSADFIVDRKARKDSKFTIFLTLLVLYSVVREYRDEITTQRPTRLLAMWVCRTFPGFAIPLSSFP